MYMVYYLSRYIGKYRVKSEIDLDTNDFPRDSKGQIEDCNTYIKCSNNAKIFHYGRSILECYVPSIGRGRNILRAIGAELGLNIKSYGKPFNYRSFYKDLENKEVVFDIYESDEEVGWKFHSKHMDLIAKYENEFSDEKLSKIIDNLIVCSDGKIRRKRKPSINNIIHKNGHHFYVFNSNMELYKEYFSHSACYNELKIHPHTIKKYIDTNIPCKKGYYFYTSH